MFRRHLAVIVTLLATWWLSIYGIFWFFRTIIQWPREAIVLLFTPLFVVYVPMTIAVAIAGNERHVKGEEVVLGKDVLIQFAIVGVASLVLLLVLLWAVALYRAGAYLGISLAAVIAATCIWVLSRGVRQATKLLMDESRR